MMIRNKIAVIAFLLCSALVFSQTDTTAYNVSTVSPASFSYSSASPQTETASITTARPTNANVTTQYYHLISAALHGSRLVGQRKVYRDGDASKESIPLFIRPKNNANEIGTEKVSGTTVISGTMNRGNPSTIQFDVVLGTQSGMIPDGTYTNKFTFQMYTGALLPPSGSQATAMVGTLSIDVTAVVFQQIVNVTINPTTLSFGTNMVAGQSYSTSAFVSVEASTHYNMTVTSANSGHIRLSSTEAIPYIFSFDGTTYLLSSGSAEVLSNAPFGTDSFPINFSINNLGFFEAGLYTDNLFFNVIAQ
jgi:hypothetical protein